MVKRARKLARYSRSGRRLLRATKGRRTGSRAEGRKKWSRRRSSKKGKSLYQQGYDAGYKAGTGAEGKDDRSNSEQSPDKMYQNGRYDGGERLIDDQLGGLDVLLDVSLEEIIASGISTYRPQAHRLMDTGQVAARIMQALDNRTPLSIVRLGDGELLTLAQETVMSIEDVKREGHFLAYAGVFIPDLTARDKLLASVLAADIIGIPQMRLPNYQLLAGKVFRANGINYRNLQLTVSTINYTLHLEGFLRNILAGRRLLYIGNSAPELASVMEQAGMHTAGILAPVHGIHDADRIVHLASTIEFDLALVGAGIAAVPIAEQIASRLGKVAIDFGHLANSFVKGEAQL